MIRTKVLPVLCLVFTGQAFAALFGGNWGNSLYLHDDKIDTARPLLGYYENLDLYARKINGTDISVFSNVSYADDYASPGHVKAEVNHLYLDWAGFSENIDLRAGRQRSYEGNTPVYFDGLNVTGRLPGKFIVQAGGGLKIPSRYSDSLFVRAYGSAVVTAMGRLDYRLSKGQAGLIYQHEANDSTAAMQDLGAYVSGDINDRLSGRTDLLFDAIQGAIRSFQAAATYQLNDKLTLDGLFSKEEYRVDSSSVFEIKVYQSYYEGVVDASYSLSEDIIVGAGYTLRRFENDSLAHALSATLAMARARVGVRQEMGYGGALTLADAAVRAWQCRMARAWVKSGLARYGEEGDLAWMGGVDLNAGPAASFWNVNLDAQLLRNPSYQYDFRAYIGTNLFFTKFIK